MKHIPPNDYLSKKASFLLVDVRTPEEWAEHHEEGAKHLPLDEIEACVSLIPKNIPLAVICRTGGRSVRACEFLTEAGFDAHNVLGGMVALANEKKRLNLIDSGEHERISRAIG